MCVCLCVKTIIKCNKCLYKYSEAMKVFVTHALMFCLIYTPSSVGSEVLSNSDVYTRQSTRLCYNY